jgi:hypothetical protein
MEGESVNLIRANSKVPSISEFSIFDGESITTFILTLGSIISYSIIYNQIKDYKSTSKTKKNVFISLISTIIVLYISLLFIIIKFPDTYNYLNSYIPIMYTYDFLIIISPIVLMAVNF